MIPQGTTPYITIEIPDYDLTSAQSVIVTLESGGRQYNFDTSRVAVGYEDESTELVIHLTQTETLALRPEFGALIQVRWMDEAGEAHITKTYSDTVAECLYKGVL